MKPFTVLLALLPAVVLGGVINIERAVADTGMARREPQTTVTTGDILSNNEVLSGNELFSDNDDNCLFSDCSDNSTNN